MKNIVALFIFTFITFSIPVEPEPPVNPIDRCAASICSGKFIYFPFIGG